ncbi:MAG: Unknown protein [uncultured Thiotrichaceae bacterium]|uniref:Competence protein ComEA n=1 Tax=uncultured Thiotrichaceae bacterium TaxID=298394 RepID=A0A6S6T8A2_9GAMM|nr:MAG: Unknown protein [uncultured Thiotrichaceae bacterium]
MNIVKKTIVGLTTALILTTSAFAGMVNINKADALTMQKNLKGVGKVKAESIVKYRKQHGAFKKIEDIVNVKGIGPKILKKNLKDLSLKQGAVKTIISNKQPTNAKVEKAPEAAPALKETTQESSK